MSHDAVVVGAGPNGLVAANHLVDAGWSVLVLEAQPRPGGAVRSDRDVHPEHVHDTFSSFYPLAAASPAIQALELERHGLAWRHAPAVLGHPLPDGRWAMLHRDRDRTARELEGERPGDGEAWLQLCETWDRVGDQLVGSLLSPFPPVRRGASLLARLPSVGGIDFLRTLLAPATSLGRTRFAGEQAHLLLAGNAGHADIPLDGAGSGAMALLMTMTGQAVGFPVPVGGAQRLTDALVARLQSRGGEVRCDAPVTRVVVERGRARAVVVDGEERVDVAHAVLADVTADRLYGGLVREEELPVRVVRAMRHFELDAATVKVDWALDGPVPWASPPPVSPGAVHVADSVEEMSRAWSQVATGAVPDLPFLLMGQMTTADPSRSPAGTEAVWAYTHVPQRVRVDAGGDGIGGSWGHDERERMADRMQARIERLAPGFGARVRARRVLGPRELEARNANLRGGAINGGTAQLHQQLVFRPVPGWGRAETPVPGLYLASSSAHPGGGVHGAPGRNAARAAVAHRRWRRAGGAVGVR